MGEGQNSQELSASSVPGPVVLSLVILRGTLWGAGYKFRCGAPPQPVCISNQLPLPQGEGVLRLGQCWLRT